MMNQNKSKVIELNAEEKKTISVYSENSPKRCLDLPKIKYGPFCLKILKEFIDHHGLQTDLPLPVNGLCVEKTLSRIFDIILYSMGEEKRKQFIDELEEYKLGI